MSHPSSPPLSSSRIRVPLLLVAACIVYAASCSGRTTVSGDARDAGVVVVGEGEGEGAVSSEGEGEGAASSEGEGEGVASSEGEGEGGGEIVDAGNGFDLGSLFDGGLPDELSCLPTQLPDLSVQGALDLLAFSPYVGRRETGVVCGDVTCDANVPCCVLCGFGACAGVDDAGVTSCPSFTQSYGCDGSEECPQGEDCCFTLRGTECRPSSECDFDVGSALDAFRTDGGFNFFPDAGPTPDAGFVDGGFTDGGFLSIPVDGGDNGDGGILDGGFLDGGPGISLPIDGGSAPQPDGGSFRDTLNDALDQGVPVCRSSLFDCDILSAEMCCTSDRLTAVDVGFCLPALLCAGNLLP